jgi:hypothetical protein
VALVALLAPVAEAGATSGGGSRSPFCRTARALQDSYERIDETDPDESVDDLEEAEQAYERLADQAPTELRRAFRRIRAFFPTLKDAASGELDIDDRSEGARFVRAAKKAGTAFEKVFEELDDRCGIEID